MTYPSQRPLCPGREAIACLLFFTGSSSFFSSFVTSLPLTFFLPSSTPYLFRYHCLKGCASTCTMVFFVKVFVRTNSLLVALYTTSTKRTFLVQFSEPHEKLPASMRSARYFMLPPRQRTGRTRLEPILHSAAGRPISNLRFFWWMFLRPPVFRCLWRESL